MNESLAQVLEVPVEEAVLIERGDQLHKVIKFAIKNNCVTDRDGEPLYWVSFEGEPDKVFGLTEEQLRQEFNKRRRP